MEQNEGVQETAVAQEETAVEAPVETEAPKEEPEEKTEETVVLKKSDFNKLNRKAIAYEVEKKKPIEVKAQLDVEDYIDISASLEGLDQREKEYLASQHRLSGKPLGEIRKSEDFSFWQSAYRAKVEKERQALSPTSTQADSERPMSLAEKLKNASLAEKEEILRQQGMYRDYRPRDDRRNIGGVIGR